MIKNVQTLCSIDGISGREIEVRKKIEELLNGCCDLWTDALGNLIAFKKGKRAGKRRVMVSAHLDEVGLMITAIEKDGMLRFTAVGGVKTEVLAGSSVRVGRKKVPGILGCKPIHLQTKTEKGTPLSLDSLFIDIGVDSFKDASARVEIGDEVSFYSEWIEFGAGRVKAKALDDRFGCAALIRLLQLEQLEYDLFGCFVTQEEVGLRGAKTAAYQVNPDVAIVLEATTASDILGVEESKTVCKLGKGPVLSFMDTRTLYDRELYRLGFTIAREKGIACQSKNMLVGGNDAGAISQTGNGVRCMAISLPCRYIHSPSCVADLEDMEESYQLLSALVQDHRIMSE